MGGNPRVSEREQRKERVKGAGRGSEQPEKMASRADRGVCSSVAGGTSS